MDKDFKKWVLDDGDPIEGLNEDPPPVYTGDNYWDSDTTIDYEIIWEV